MTARRLWPQGWQPGTAFHIGHFNIYRKFLNLPDNTKGIVVLLLAAIGFSVMAALIKLAGTQLAVVQIIFIRQILMTLIVLPQITRDLPGSLKTSRPGLHLTRVAVALVAMLSGFTAVVHLPLADAAAISFAKSFFVTVFAILILHETVGIRRWSATIVGFAGVAIMLQPGSAGYNIYGLLAVIGAICAGLVMIIIRLLTRTESAPTIMLFQSAGVGLALAAPAWYYWQQPSATEWLLLLAIGGISFCSQMGNIFAYKWGEASMLAPLEYTRLLYATGLGLLIFGTLPSGDTVAGASLIVGAALYTVHRETTLKRNNNRGKLADS